MAEQGMTLRRLISWSQKSGFAVLDQGLFAGANFLVNILLARWLEPAQYGAFAVAYSAFLLLAAFHTAILTEPMLVFGAGKYAENFPNYLGMLIRAHWAITGVIALMLGLAAVVSWQLGFEDMAEALAGLAISSPFILLLWLVRRAFYVRSQPQWAASGGVLYILLMLIGMVGLYRNGWLSAVLALVLIGFVSLAVSLWLSTLLRPQGRFGGSNPTPSLVLQDHWGYGRWSTATTVLMWAPSNIYYMFLPAWVGLEGSAALRAVRNLVMPILHATSAIAALLIPQFTRLFKDHGPEGLHRLGRFAMIMFAAEAVVYWGLLVTFRHQLMTWLYGGQYGEYGDLLILLGVLPLFDGAVAVFGGALRARQRPKQVFWCYVASGCVALTFGLWLLATRGVVGAVVGQLASSATKAVAMIWSYTSQPVQSDDEGHKDYRLAVD